MSVRRVDNLGGRGLYTPNLIDPRLERTLDYYNAIDDPFVPSATVLQGMDFIGTVTGHHPLSNEPTPYLPGGIPGGGHSEPPSEGPSLGRRVVRAGATAAVVAGAAVLGAKIGAALGWWTGPGALVTAGIGAAIGAVVGFFL